MKGWGELLLLGVVCAACWLRTPVGALGHNAVALFTHEPGRDLLSHFSTELPERVDDTLRRALAQRDGGQRYDVPEGWTPGQVLAVQAHLGEEAWLTVSDLADRQPEAALEEWAVGAELRSRAIRRARAAGMQQPERLDNHRRYLPAEQAARADRSVTEVLALATALDLGWPVDPGVRVSSPFGWREHPVLSKRRFHEGVDLAVPVGTPIHAVGAGSVSRARADAVNGRYLVVDHGHGVTSAYCHNSALHVQKSQQVDKGELVADSGNSGRSTGPHLHFGLRIHGRAVDPAVFRPVPQEEVPSREPRADASTRGGDIGGR